MTWTYETERSGGDGDRLAHNPEVAGSNPVPATKSKRPSEMGGFTRSLQHSRFERLRRPCRFRRIVFGLVTG